MEAIRSSETSVLIRATRRHLPEDDNHHSHRRGNLKSYISLFVGDVLVRFVRLHVHVTSPLPANVVTSPFVSSLVKTSLPWPEGYTWRISVIERCMVFQEIG
jgi:hypothetical protein